MRRRRRATGKSKELLMSRYEFVPTDWPATFTFAIGWENALATHFAQVIDTAIPLTDDRLLVSLGHEPPKFDDLDALMRVLNQRIQGSLPEITLTPDLRRQLRKDASAKRPVVNHIDLMPPGQRAPSETLERPVVLPWWELGTDASYLNAFELREAFDGMGPQFFRLQDLYEARIEAGLTEDRDEGTRLVLHNIKKMAAIGHILASIANAPDILVAKAALDAFSPILDEAARVFESESARLWPAVVH
jgi:hypothetical protein